MKWSRLCLDIRQILSDVKAIIFSALDSESAFGSPIHFANSQDANRKPSSQHEHDFALKVWRSVFLGIFLSENIPKVFSTTKLLISTNFLLEICIYIYKVVFIQLNCLNDFQIRLGWKVTKENRNLQSQPTSLQILLDIAGDLQSYLDYFGFFLGKTMIHSRKVTWIPKMMVWKR